MVIDPYDNIVEIERSIVLPEKVFETSKAFKY